MVVWTRNEGSVVDKGDHMTMYHYSLISESMLTDLSRLLFGVKTREPFVVLQVAFGDNWLLCSDLGQLLSLSFSSSFVVEAWTNVHISYRIIQVVVGCQGRGSYEDAWIISCSGARAG